MKSFHLIQSKRIVLILSLVLVHCMLQADRQLSRAAKMDEDQTKEIADNQKENKLLSDSSEGSARASTHQDRPHNEQQADDQQAASSNSDWLSFKKKFNKHYPSLKEQMNRYRLFIARQVKTFITKLKYKFHELPYYTSINQYSDLTPEEREKLIGTTPSNKEIKNDADAHQHTDHNDDDDDTFSDTESFMDDDEAAELLQDELIKRDQDVANDHQAPESRGLKALLGDDDHQSQSWFNRVRGVQPGSATRSLSRTKRGFSTRKADLLVQDWRRSNCISPPIDQGLCLGCYAISAMAYMEWALCMSQKDRPSGSESQSITRLSPQYILSCGPQFQSETKISGMNLNGCQGGLSKFTMHFVRDYGVEFEMHMPYMAAWTPCPVPLGTPKDQRGRLRPQVDTPIRMRPDTKQLDTALDIGPVITSIKISEESLDYGGGIIDNCPDSGGHAVLLVGRGTDNGVDFLLAKNSFGESWGLNGYFKINRSKISQCAKEFISPRVSFR